MRRERRLEENERPTHFDPVLLFLHSLSETFSVTQTQWEFIILQTDSVVSDSPCLLIKTRLAMWDMLSLSIHTQPSRVLRKVALGSLVGVLKKTQSSLFRLLRGNSKVYRRRHGDFYFIYNGGFIIPTPLNNFKGFNFSSRLKD